MKTKRIKLAEWQDEDQYETIEVDWPRIQKQIGQDHLSWLLKQPKNCCQLVIEQLDRTHKLTAEFYDEKTLLSYHLMWAK
jgi:hypothetical protein